MSKWTEFILMVRHSRSPQGRKVLGFEGTVYLWLAIIALSTIASNMPYHREDVSVHTLPFEEILLGQEAEFVHQLTEQDLQAFASLTGDFNPIHSDAHFAQKTTFRKPVVHGMLSASFISTLIGTRLPGAGALWVSQKLDFHSAARIGDVLNVRARVKAKSESSRTISLEIEITRQDGQRLVCGESVVKVLDVQEEKTKTPGSGKFTVLVTGGSRGIGAAIADRLANDGHSVVVNYRQSAAEADQIVGAIVARGHRAIAVPGDVSQEKDVENIFSLAQNAFGDVLGVVHCAGSASQACELGELQWADFQTQLNLHLKGAFHCVKAALPGMLAAQQGSFVFIGSIFADGRPPVKQADYVVAKSALAALMRSLAAEYGPKGIRANAIAPGMTLTDMIANVPEKAKILARMQTPLRRLGEPSDVAASASFLLSPDARHLTGETLRVCGGAVML
jgi:3-oxoacyl-[acyl-carrier protein] reductase